MLEPDPNFPSWQAHKHAAELSYRCDACGASAADVDLELYHQPNRTYWLCLDEVACYARRMAGEQADTSLDDTTITAIVDLWSADWLEADTRELWRTWM